jgi:cyclopropane-fatty-acyl-phospholipid synthase
MKTSVVGLVDRTGSPEELPVETPAPRTVVQCYDLLDRMFPECGLLDMTDGMYLDDPSTTYEQAQQNQVNWLLDEVGCEAGSRILDLGCGYGTLLKAASERGADAVGITVSPRQVARCRQAGLNAVLLNYRDVPASWNGRFDAIIANGSIEHFVQPEEYVAGQADDVYRKLFEICARILDPRSESGRMATTVIHFNDYTPRPEPAEVLRGPLSFRWGSPKFHYAMLQRSFGGFYPWPGQLERGAAGLFTKENEVDGTEDYRRTSEQWFERVRHRLLSLRGGPRMAWRIACHLLRHPVHGATMFCCLLISESWQRQFRGEHPATRLLRQTWRVAKEA